ncbi:MAG: DEAD/DEAH box helicase [Lachnospiraceae bacterium]
MKLMNNEEVTIHPDIIRAIEEMGFEQMTPIQEQAIPVLLSGKDIIGQAQTGTGKTAAFGIPLVQMVDQEQQGVQGLILCPTRELAIQAAQEIRKFSKFMQGIKVLPIYGGQDISNQIRSLRTAVSIVVGTPGRVMDHMRRNTLKLNNVRTVVLDEADEMLNMGFREDIETILEKIPQQHQTALFSATMPKAILDITKKYQNDAVLIKVAAKEMTVPLIKQYYYEVSRQNKEEAITRLLDYYNPQRTLIFCNTKRMVDEISDNLKGRGYFAEALHGDLNQTQRDKVMHSFRNGGVNILIATDVAARGIDVDDVEAVINFDVPQDIEYYVHRIGRTGRAGKKGRAFTLIVGKDVFKIRDIEHYCKTTITARTLPSVADITQVKAEKILDKVLDTWKSNDLDSMTKMIENTLNEEECTAIELAAAFLKMHMGQELEDIPEEKYVDRQRNNRKPSGNKGAPMRNNRDRDRYKGHRGKADSQAFAAKKDVRRKRPKTIER